MLNKLSYATSLAFFHVLLTSCSEKEWSPSPVTSPLAATTSITDWVGEQLWYYQTYGSCRMLRKTDDQPYFVLPPTWSIDCTLQSHLMEDGELTDPIQSTMFKLAFEAVEGMDKDEPLRYFKLVIDNTTPGWNSGNKEHHPLASLSCIVSWYNDRDRGSKLSFECEEFPKVDGMNHFYERHGVSSAILSTLDARMKAQERKMLR